MTQHVQMYIEIERNILERKNIQIKKMPLIIKVAPRGHSLAKMLGIRRYRRWDRFRNPMPNI
tara:strand:- start:522 stop:707 length:186 start_codon:yes stop_codon:yes gene_type:complete